MSASTPEREAVARTTVIAVLAATTLAQVASVMGTAVFPVIAPRLAAEMGVAPATIGYQISLVYGVAALASPFMSFAVVRWGACRATQVGLSFCVAGMALALSSSIAALAVTSVLLGLAMTLMTPASGHLLFRFTPTQNRNLIFSIKQTGVPLGWMAMALAAPAITVAFGWRWAVAVVLVVALGVGIALQRVRARWDDDRRPDAPVSANPRAGLALLWRQPVLRWLSIASLFLTFVQMCVATFLVTMLVDELGYSLVTAGVLLSVLQGAGVGGRILWGWLADRSGDSLGLLQKIAMTMTACCIATAFLGTDWPTALIAALLLAFGAAAVGWNGLFLAEIARCSPRGMVSVATSAAMMWNFGGILIGPALFATVFKWNGSYAMTYGWLSIVALLGVAALTLCREAARKEARNER